MTCRQVVIDDYFLHQVDAKWSFGASLWDKKISRKIGEVLDLAEKLSDQTQVRKHPQDLGSMAAFCLYLLSLLSIMLRDLQDASAMPQKISFLSALMLILNNLPAMG